MKKNEGYTIIKEVQITDTRTVVLGKREKDGRYVTWLYSQATQYYWGHYCNTEEVALKDFYTRIAEEATEIAYYYDQMIPWDED